MAESGADNDQRLRPAPKRLEHFGNRFRRGISHHQRHQHEFIQQGLQKGQVHLEAVLERMRVVEDFDRGQVQTGNRFLVQWHVTQRRSEHIGAAQSQSTDRHAMAGAQQDHPGDLVPVRPEPDVSRRGDRAGVDIAGVRHDQCFGPGSGPGRGLIEVLLDGGA